MTINHKILTHYPELDDGQREFIGHTDGPLLGVAGPGSGKTRAISLHAANLILSRKTHAREILMCTFSRDAAAELRTRFERDARVLGVPDDPAQARVGTIHGLCRHILSWYPKRVGSSDRCRVLNEHEQLALLAEAFDLVFDADTEVLGRRGWGLKRDFVDTARRFFDRISEELIDVDQLIDCNSPFHSAVGRSYQRYRSLLRERGLLDFGLMQLTACEALEDDHIAGAVSARTRRLLVDEVQDITHVQDVLVRRIAGDRSIISAVGDPYQRIYGFRGADLEPLVRFPERFPSARIVRLNVNYRSHRGIVDRLNLFMDGANGPGGGGGSAIFERRAIVSHRPEQQPDYPSVISVVGTDPDDEARQVAELIMFLARHRVIGSLQQIAVLLFSLRGEPSGSFVTAFRDARIPAFLKPAGTPRQPDGPASRPDGVLITTIHQSKGREWPVVALSSLDQPSRQTDQVGAALGHHRRAGLHESARGSDAACLHYVGMSRPCGLLVLSTNLLTPPLPSFDRILDTIPVWPAVDTAALAAQRLGPADDTLPSRRRKRLVIDRVGRIIAHGKPR